MPDRNNNISLKTSPFQFVEYKPIEYKPIEADLNILNRSMEKIEARRYQAESAKDALDKTANVLREQLNPEEYKAFDDKISDIRDRINLQTELGNYGRGILLASELGRNLANDTSIKNKINAQAIREARKKEYSNGSYDPYTRRRWDATNKYYDDGTGTWKESFVPVKDMSFESLLDLADSRTPVRTNSIQGSTTRNGTTFITNKGGLTNRPIETKIVNGKPIQTAATNILGQFSSTATTKGGGTTISEKKASDIVNVFSDMMDNDSSIYAAVKQDFDNMIWLYNEATRVLNDDTATDAEKEQARTDLQTAKNSLEDKDGHILDTNDDKTFKTWWQTKVTSMANNRAYRNKSTSSTDNITTSYPNSGTEAAYGLGQNKAKDKYSPSDTHTQGANLTDEEADSQPHNVDYVSNLVIPYK